MLPTVLVQCAAGCFLAVALSSMRSCGRQYLRLMAVVALGIAFLALLLRMMEAAAPARALQEPAGLLLLASVALGIVWLFVNAAQHDAIADSQRLWPALAAAAGLAAVVFSILETRGHAPGRYVTDSRADFAILAVNAVLGSALLGACTAAMLLGHRYLTDADMTIAPLRHLTKLYLTTLAARVAWVLAASFPLWSESFRPAHGGLYFWLAFWVRVGVGLVVSSIFAWMIWDCVRRRATQSATALYYLSMLMVFSGELAGAYLARTERLAL